jgi:curli biogenesis system outer membrane secretion channel CsgG
MFGEFEYAAGTWDKPRRVIARLEHGEQGANPRFIVTDLKGSPKALYGRRYCARGVAENRIKEAQLDLFGHRAQHPPRAGVAGVSAPHEACLHLRSARTKNQQIAVPNSSSVLAGGISGLGRQHLRYPPVERRFRREDVPMFNRPIALLGIAALLALTGCATESSRTLAVEKVQSAAITYTGEKVPISVGKFDNRSSFMRGVFSDGVDRLGSQAKTTLVAHLQQSQRFNVLDRENMEETKLEAQLQGQAQKLRGASFVVTGDISEFGRKEVGDQQLFGILGRGKVQVAYAKLTLNVVDIRSSEVVYSARGAGEYELSNREVLGFGGTSSYDATLSGKVLDLAMREAVNNLVSAKDAGLWGVSGPRP